MIVDGAFLVAGCDAALLLEAVDQALDAVALAINGPIKAGVAALIVFCRDDRGDAPAPDPAARGLTARFESYGAGSRLRLGWARRWSMRRIAARVTIASETSGSAS